MSETSQCPEVGEHSAPLPHLLPWRGHVAMSVPWRSFPVIGDNSGCTWEEASVGQTAPSQTRGPWVSPFFPQRNPCGQMEGKARELMQRVFRFWR